IALQGTQTMAGAEVDRVGITWANGGDVAVEGGRLAGHLSALAGADQGGLLAGTAAFYDSLAETVASTVNAIHQTGTTLGPPPVTGTDFFSFAAGLPSALGLTAITDPTAIAAGNAAGGPLDGSVADAIAQLAH